MPGGSVNLTCVAVGSPMPFIKWRLGAVELTPEESMPIGKNILMLTDIRDSATYTCVATSDLGNIEYDAEIRVKGWWPSLSGRVPFPSNEIRRRHLHGFTSSCSGVKIFLRLSTAKFSLPPPPSPSHSI